MQAFLQKHKWVILLSGALIQLFTGIATAWGVFQGEVSTVYNLSQHETTMVFSFIICFFGIGCVVGGFLQDKKGPRIAGFCGSALLLIGFMCASFVKQGSSMLFYLGFSIPVGVGTAFLYPCVMSCAQKWYADKKGFATGVIGLAVGFSGGCLTLIASFLIAQFNIRIAFFSLGIIMAVICFGSSIFLQNPKTINNQNEKNHFSIKQMLKTKQYWLLFFSACLSTASMLLFSPIIVQICTDKGLSRSVALSSIAICSICSAAGRLSMPWLGDKIGPKKVFVILFCCLFALSVLFSFIGGIFIVVVYCALGFFYSGQSAVVPSAVTGFFGQKNSGIHYGLVALGTSLGSIAFPILANAFQGFECRHFIAIGASFAAIVLSFMLKPINKTKI